MASRPIVPPPPRGYKLVNKDEDDIPPPPEGFTRVDTPPPATSPQVIDGDTIRMPNGVLRLYGVDAPELRQQGWNREGVAVPVGQQARDTLSGWMQGQSLRPGPTQGESYGRTVAPVSLGGYDLAQRLAREGDALASPQFVDDPQYRFELLQAERLARLNQLGPMHDNFVQTPAENRANPGYIPARETVAVFHDTPTPLAGMRPEVEARYLELLNTATDPKEVVAFVESQGGFKVDPTEIANWIRTRDATRAAGNNFNASGAVTYYRGPEILTDLGDGRLGAGSRSFFQGFTAGGLDELGAIPDALGGTPGRENIWNSDRRFADIWANNQRQNASILGYDESAYPYLTTTGNVAGGVTSAFILPGGQARTVGQLAKVGAAYGGAAGFLSTDGGVADRTQNAIIGATMGTVANPLLGKAVEAASPWAVRAFQRVARRTPPPGSGVAGDVAEGYADNDLSDAAQTLARGGREVDRIDLPPGTPGSAYARPEPVETGYPGPSGGRERDWLDIAGIPAPPEGYRLDPSNDNAELARVIGMDAEGMPSLAGELRPRDYIDVGRGARPQRLDQPLSEAQQRALLANVRPADVLPMPSNEIASADEAAAIDAGRFVPATAPNETAALSRERIRNWRGQEVPKVGPLDMVGWLRTRGGVNDAGDALSRGGELSAMGIRNNAARRGLDFVGTETRFGPIINNASGMSPDEAAHAAWEAGYFPELTERPTVNQFLDALRETYEGGANRRWRADDLPQIDAFYGRQSDRFNLEQQQHAAGGPVFVDRSQPADEAAPFAPAQAYEEWPAEAVKWAGNINLDRLDTPQDIRRALVQMNNRVGFDAATRGRVTQAETERLASDLGMTANDLLTRRRGQALNAEEALAARQILAKSGNELVNLARRVQQVENPGDELGAAFERALLRHTAIQEQVSGMTAEAGRALQQFRMMADSRAAPREVLAALAQHGGGNARIREAADMILDAVDDGLGRFNTITRKAANPRFSDKMAELYINFLLSGPQTHVVNAVSNSMTAISQIPEQAVAAGIGGLRRLAAGKQVDRVMAGEVGARLFSLTQGVREGLQFMGRALRTGETSDTFSKIAGHDMRAIPGLAGEVVRVPGRLLNSADELFKGISRRAEINAMAYRQAHREGLTGEALTARIADLSANPPEAIEHKALDFARYMTFQRPLSGPGQNVQRVVREYPLLRPIITFVRTPANLLKFAAERSPAAPLLREWRADMRAGGARRDLAIARATLGTGIAAMAYQWALEGRITGGAPTDAAKNRFQRADGWQPYSVRIGDKWVSYSRLDPFAMQIGAAADLATRSQGMTDKQLEHKAGLLVASMMSQLADKTWLSGVADFTNAMTDPERYAGPYLRRLGASAMIPNLSAQTARAVDPVQRERETFSEELQARIPGVSDNLLPSRDIWGAPIEDGARLGPDVLNPFRQSTIKNDPVNREMLAIGARIGPPGRSYTIGGVEREWTPEQFDQLQAMAGKAAHDSLAGLIATPQWSRMSSAARTKAVQKVVRIAREDAKRALLGLPSRTNRAPAGNVPAPPPGFVLQ